MEKTMTLSGQIDKAVSLYRAMLEKHSKSFDSRAVQTALGQSGLVDDMFSIFRSRVEAVSNLIVRTIRVNRSLTPQQVLDATGREQHVNNSVIAGMPKGEGDEVEVVFFNLGRFISDNDLEKEYQIRGLEAADPYSLAAVNAVDPTFGDNHPSCTHWKNSDGRWCYSSFSRWGGRRGVGVFQSDIVWDDDWWFAGLRK
ncbi:MAG TPA: hypothetical protein VFQ59_01505 [Candidatus Paceibacterota bacterium]|nr:hypothetical protein [Candidatus Paceibacterota bacterium]